MKKTINREELIDHLEGYKKYLVKLKREQDGADMSAHQLWGAVEAVKNLIREVKTGKV